MGCCECIRGSPDGIASAAAQDYPGVSEPYPDTDSVANSKTTAKLGPLYLSIVPAGALSGRHALTSCHGGSGCR